jgi:hypothetical protein
MLPVEMRAIRSCALPMCLALAACGEPGAGRSGAAPAAPPSGHEAAPEWFEERAVASGIDFVHVNGASGHYFYPEILAPGVAMLDYDNDGDLDVYLVQGEPLAAGAAARSGVSPTGRGRLYRNDVSAGGGAAALHFTDVTAQSGLDVRGFGLGVATGDIDNDGWVDLYLTRFGASQLWRNGGDGTFTDVTARSGTANVPGFGVSAAFLDFDRDGWLDLYVGNNVDHRLETEKVCPGPSGARDYCPPQVYGSRADRLYRNRGAGRFMDVTATALVGGTFGPALGVATADFDGDGWIDVYVANDGEENLLWINQRDGTFRDRAVPAGAALTAEGKAESSMGVDAGDYDNDGDDDIIITELTGEGSNLFLNEGGARFRDVGALSGLAGATLPYTGWGTAWVDIDNDGWLDTLAVNGTIIAGPNPERRSFPYDQRKILLRNRGDGRLEPVGARAGRAFAESEAGRGAAFGDIDNDGDADVLVGNNGGPTRLLINQVGASNHWIGIRAVGTAGGRDMLGARVGVTRANGTTVWRRARADGSYASANDPRVLVGLGTDVGVVTVEVRWPDGGREAWASLPIDRWHTLRAGNGR